MNGDMYGMTDRIAKETTNEVDKYLLSFFGSLENAKEFGKLYVLETYTPEMETIPDENGLSFRVKMTTEYRLRLKTEAELKAEREQD